MKKDSPTESRNVAPMLNPTSCDNEIEVNTSKTVLQKTSSIETTAISTTTTMTTTTTATTGAAAVVPTTVDEHSSAAAVRQSTLDPHDLESSNESNGTDEKSLSSVTGDGLDDKILPENRAESLYNRICSRTFRQMSKTDSQTGILDDTNSIQYGNLTDSYDPNSSLHTKSRLELALLNSGVDLMPSESDREAAEASKNSALEFFRKIKEMNKLDVRNLKLIRKSSIITLIERNRVNSIFCPFDEFVYFRLKSRSEEETKTQTPELASLSPYDKIKIQTFRLSKIADFDLMPNSVSTFAMQFFLDIIRASELKQFPPTTLPIIMHMKNVPAHLNLTETNIVTCSVDHIFWNCFALYKCTPNMSLRNGYLNYLLSTSCLLEHFRRVQDTVLFEKLDKILPYFIEALVLNGLLKPNDLSTMNEAYKKHVGPSDDNNAETPPPDDFSYFPATLERIERVLRTHTPMKLRQMCRMCIKQNVRNFGWPTLKSLPLIDEDARRFLIFDNELNRCYKENFTQPIS